MLKKLSLAALMALGTASVASATPLTDAIKNVDLNGFLRVRFYNEDPEGKASYNRWRTNAVFIFKVPVAENIKFVVRNSVETNVYTNKSKLNPSGTTSTNVDDALVNNLLFMQYTNGPINAKVGKIPVATSITSADPAKPGHGAGIIATYTANKSFTVGAAFIDALRNPGNNTGLNGSKTDLDNDEKNESLANLDLIGNDIYAAVVLFNTNGVKGNVWYYHATKLVDNIVTLSANYSPTKEIALHLDYAQGKLDSDAVIGYELNKKGDQIHAKDAGLDKTHTYFNISATYTQPKFCAQIGYAQTNDKKGIVELSEDAPIGDVLPVETRYNIANELDVTAYYAKVAYNVDPKTTAYLGYAYVDQGEDARDNDSSEYKIGAKYKVNKKLGFDVYYDIYDADAKKADDNKPLAKDNNEFRFEAKYSF